MAIQIAGTTALVTGANRGIGRALVEALLERGAARVYATARRPEALGDLVARYGERVVPVRLDVTRPSEVRAVAAQAGDVRLLINNAGIVAKFGGELTDADWMTAARDEFEVNVLGALSLTQATRALLAPHGVHVAGVYPGPIDTDMARPFEMVKTAPEAAAHAILDGLEDGREEIFPDPTARELGELFLHDPKALERQFAATVTASTNA